MSDDEPLYVENCKHAVPDALIVQRNEGIRWVTCVDCGADFVRQEFLVAADAELEQARQVIDAARVYRDEMRSEPGWDETWQRLSDALDAYDRASDT